MIIIRKKLVKYLFYALYRKAYIKLFWLYPNKMPAIRNPHIIELELTNDCNFGCIHCHRKKMRLNLGYIDVKIFKKLIDEISTYPITFLRLVGRGEPTLHPDLAEIMEYLKNKQIKVELSTNGNLFNNFSYEEILSWNIDILDISVDGIDKDTYNEIRKNGDYECLKKNIGNFYNIRNKLNRHSPIITIRNVIFPNFSQHQISIFKSTWLNISDCIYFNNLNPLDANFVRQKYFRCNEIFFIAHVRWNGRVAICGDQFIYGKDKFIGDLKNEQLSQIWQNPELSKLRLLHRNRDIRDNHFCYHCFPCSFPNPKIVVPKNL
jgi:MoaA/NifB/PqqE/SkfB family radical SAM enzyme